MKKVFLLTFSLIILFFLFTGCSTKKVMNSGENKESLSNQKQDSSHVSGKTKVTFNLQSLKNELKRKGYNIQIDNKLSNSLLSVKPISFDYKGEKFTVYEYQNKANMENDAGLISKDGTFIKGDGKFIKGSMYDYKASPHFYKKGNIIVMYVGENIDLIKIFKQIMGKQFAGF